MLLSYCSQFGNIPNQLHSRNFKCQQRPSTAEAEVLVCAKYSLFSRKRSLFSIATELTNRMHPCIRSATCSHKPPGNRNNTGTQKGRTNLKQSPQSHWTGYTARAMSRERYVAAPCMERWSDCCYCACKALHIHVPGDSYRVPEPCLTKNSVKWLDSCDL